AGEHEVRVAVHEAGDHGPALDVEAPVGDRPLARAADPGDPAVIDDHRGVLDRPLWTVRGQLADVGEEQAAHGIAVASSCATSMPRCLPSTTTGTPSTTTW